MGQSGCWDEEKRIHKLHHKKPVLTTLFESIPWESLRSLIEQGYTHERKSNAGRKRIDPLILFKMLVLQQLFNLSDDELEFQVNDSTVLSSTYEPKGWKPAVDRLSMPRLCLSPSREIPEQRIKPSWKASCPRDGKTSRTLKIRSGEQHSQRRQLPHPSSVS
jgi:hypothetical protein